MASDVSGFTPVFTLEQAGNRCTLNVPNAGYSTAYQST